MADLIIPSEEDVHGIVVDMIPVVAQGAKQKEIHHSIFLTRKLIILCSIAQANTVSEKVFAEMMQGMLGVRKF